MRTLLVVELVLVVLVILILPLCSWYFDRKSTEETELRGLGLRRGSVRSMLALLVVGSTVNFLLFGAKATTTNFSEIMAALSTLSGSVIGFYFGGRTATTVPKDGEPGASGGALSGGPPSHGSVP